VQEQMSEFVHPVQMEMWGFVQAWLSTVVHLGLSETTSTINLVEMRAHPHMDHPTLINLVASPLVPNVFLLKLWPKDVATLESDPTKRDHWKLTAAEVFMPPLRTLRTIVQTKMHCAELFDISKLNTILPLTEGADWKMFLSVRNVFIFIAIYALEWEAVLCRWQEGDDAILQPDLPSYHWVLYMAMNILRAEISAREQRLSGVSSGSYGGATAAMFAKLEAVGGDGNQESET